MENKTTLATTGNLYNSSIPGPSTIANYGYCLTTTNEKDELWDFLWVYIGEDDEENTFPHEGKVFGTKTEIEKSLLVDFARTFPEVDVNDYELKLRKW